MPAAIPALLLSQDYVGLRSQALGLAEAAGLAPEVRILTPRWPWRWFAASLWPAPVTAVGGIAREAPPLVIGCGGVAAAVGAALRRRGRRVVHVQHPRMDPRRFDLIVAAVHDGLAADNVIVTRTALHRANAARLAEAAALWRPRLAHLPRPLVALLLGGSNGRFRLGRSEALALADQCLEMLRRDKVGLAITPSRRTSPVVTRLLTERLAPEDGAWVWDGAGDNPYFGLLALADAIIVTEDSVSMVSEAVATEAPVMITRLPGRSRRIRVFLEGLSAADRVRDFRGRLDLWPVRPLDDTAEAAAELRRRLSL
jgi:mitochondrial fission protein ELM1